ncbi:MAG: histone deacetylase [Myxococcota bacterium]
MKVGLLLDEKFLDHHAPAGHPERGERLIAIGQALAGEGLVARTKALAPRAATEEELRRVHRGDFVDRLRQIVPGRAGQLDADTYFSPRSWQAATLAAGAAVDMALAARAGEIEAGAAFVRPPGHHAEPGRAMGFCLLNNVAIAAAAARAAGTERVAIVDWDVHHGNGTQRAFWADPRVLYVSLHQFPYYPGTGDADEIGEGAGRGATVNLPLAAGMGDAEYLYAFDEVVSPALARFRPQLVLVSAGFDAHARDPLGGMRVTEEGFRQMTRRLVATGVPVVAVLEGGYDLGALARSSVAMVRELCEPGALSPPAGEPSLLVVRAVDRTKAALGGTWKLGGSP